MNTSTPIDPHVAAINGRKCITPRPRRGIGFPQFSDDEVLDIRRAWEAGETTVALATRYGVTRMTISALVNFHTYSHIDPEIAA